MMLKQFMGSGERESTNATDNKAADSVQSIEDDFNSVLKCVRSNADIIHVMGLENDVIELEFDKGKYKCLEIKNALPDFLHLASIRLFNNCEVIDDDSLPVYTCQAGKEYKNESMASSFQFNTLYDNYAFHTVRNIEFNWFKTVFDSPIEMDKIELMTRKNHPYRSISIEVTLTGIDDSVVSVYSGLSILKEFVHNTAIANYSCTGFSIEQYEYLYTLFLLADQDPYNYGDPIWVGYINNASEVGLDQELLKAFVENEILSLRELAFTSYGVKRCFKFWSEEELRKYLQTTRDAVDQLYDFCDSIFYAYGSLLGFIREPNGFIPHDNDIDIVCLFPMTRYHSLKEINEEMMPFLESHGFKIVTHSNYSYHVKYKGSQRFDLFPALADALGNVTIYPSHKGKYLNTSYLTPTIDIDVLGVNCPIPKNPFRFLTTVYGSDWKVPHDKNYHVK